MATLTKKVLHIDDYRQKKYDREFEEFLKEQMWDIDLMNQQEPEGEE